MAYRKNLLNIDYHYDTDTGIYEVGEIDFGISGELDNYIRQFGRRGVDGILLTLAHLMWQVQSKGISLIKNSEFGSTKCLI